MLPKRNLYGCIINPNYNKNEELAKIARLQRLAYEVNKKKKETRKSIWD